MQILQSVLVAAIAVFQSSADYVLVRSVVDGQTIVVSNVGRVRLLGIDAPEAGRGLETPAPFAREARARLTALVLHRWVRLEHDDAGRGTYNRRRAYVLTGDGTLVNAVMVREGLARVSTRTPLTRLAELQRAEAEAQAFRRGLWGRTPHIPRARYNKRP